MLKGGKFFLEVVCFFKKLPRLKGGTIIWVGTFFKNFSEGGWYVYLALDKPSD